MLMLLAIAFIGANIPAYWFGKRFYGFGFGPNFLVLVASYLCSAVTLACVVFLAIFSGYGNDFVGRVFGQAAVFCLFGSPLAFLVGRRRAKRRIK